MKAAVLSLLSLLSLSAFVYLNTRSLDPQVQAEVWIQGPNGRETLRLQTQGDSVTRRSQNQRLSPLPDVAVLRRMLRQGQGEKPVLHLILPF